MSLQPSSASARRRLSASCVRIRSVPLAEHQQRQLQSHPEQQLLRNHLEQHLQQLAVVVVVAISLSLLPFARRWRRKQQQRQQQAVVVHHQQQQQARQQQLEGKVGQRVDQGMRLSLVKTGGDGVGEEGRMQGHLSLGEEIAGSGVLPVVVVVVQVHSNLVLCAGSRRRERMALLGGMSLLPGVVVGTGHLLLGKGVHGGEGIGQKGSSVPALVFGIGSAEMV